MGCLLEAFRLQSHFCGETGSPLTRSLLACGQDTIVAGGVVAQLADAWSRRAAYRCGFPLLCRSVTCRT